MKGKVVHGGGKIEKKYGGGEVESKFLIGEASSINEL